VTGIGRLNLSLGGALLALSAAAWYLLIAQSSAIGMAMELSIPVYLAIWVTMLAAMMLPATAPLAVAYGRVAQARGGGRLAGLPFTAGYLLLWTAAGLLPLAVFVGTRGAIAGMSASPSDT
jgi:predicted metal-binding membrane protein